MTETLAPEPGPQHLEFTTEEIRQIVEGVSPDPSDLLARVPSSGELSELSELTEKVAENKGVGADHQLVDTEDAALLNAIAAPGAWVLKEETRDTLKWVATNVRALGLGNLPPTVSDQIKSRAEQLRKEGKNSREAEQQAREQIAENATSRILLSDQLVPPAESTTPEPAPASDDRNRPRGGRTRTGSDAKKVAGAGDDDPENPPTPEDDDEGATPPPAPKKKPGKKPAGTGDDAPKTPPTPEDEAKRQAKIIKQNTKLRSEVDALVANDDVSATEYVLAKKKAEARLAHLKELDPEDADDWQEGYDNVIAAKLDEVKGRFKGLGRVKLALATAKVALSDLQDKATSQGLVRVGERATKVKEFYTDKEKGKRRAIISGVIGATAVAAGIGLYFLTKGNSNAQDFVPQSAGTGSGNTPPPEMPQAPAPKVEHATVHSGDSVWKILNNADGHNNHTTAQMIHDGKVSVTDVHGHVRTGNLNLIHAGDTVNFELPQANTGGAGQTAHETTQHVAANTGAGHTAQAGPNTEVLPHYNSHTGAGTLSGATLDHLHRLNLEVPQGPGQFAEITQKVADFNHMTPEQLTHLPVGQQIDFPPQVILEQWLQHLKDTEEHLGNVKAV